MSDNVTVVGRDQWPKEIQEIAAEIEAVCRKRGVAIAYYVQPKNPDDPGLLGFDGLPEPGQPSHRPNFAVDFAEAVLHVEPLFEVFKMLIGQRIAKGFFGMVEKQFKTTH